MPHLRLSWKPEYSVNDAELDQHHQQLVKAGNHILDLTDEEHPKPEQVLELLKELENHILAHFETEEAYLKKMDYPKVKEHLFDHDHYRKQVREFIKEVQWEQQSCGNEADCRAIAEKVARFVYAWVSEHMMGGARSERFFAEKRQA